MLIYQKAKFFYNNKNFYIIKKIKKKEKKKSQDKSMVNASKIKLRIKQKPPNEYWEFWVILAGRGFGKTLAGAHCIIEFIKKESKKYICLIGATHNETRQIMVEGTSGILNLAIENNLNYKYLIQQGKIIFDNGSIVFLFSSESYEALRGFQFDCVWVDEFAKFYKPKETLEQLIFCCRLGKPNFVITTTPKPLSILKDLYNQPNTIITHGSSYENKENLPEPYFKLIQQFENTPFGDQEIHGKIINYHQDSPWHGIKIIINDIDYFNLLYKTIGVDPSVSNGNETGIILAGYDPKEKKIIILEDYSLSQDVKNWVPYLCNIIEENEINYLSIEVNQGGNLLEYTINNKLNREIIIHKFFARDNKKIRALAVANLYRQGFIQHQKNLPNLQEQMNYFTGSLDRVDALVWCIESILKNLKSNEHTINTNAWIIN